MSELVVSGLGVVSSGSVGLGSVSIDDLIKRIRLYLDENPFEATVSEDVDSSEPAIDVPDGTKWAAGNILEFDDATGELALVNSISSNTLTVKRGHRNSTATTHGNGTVILKNPSWPWNTIKDAVRRTIDTDLWPPLYMPTNFTVTTAQLTATPKAFWFDLDPDALGLISVTQLHSTNNLKVINYGERGSGYPVAFKRNLPTSLVGSGVGVYVPTRYNTNDIIVRVALKPDFDEAGFTEGSLADTIVFGALARLLEMRDLRRHTADVSVGQGSVRPGSAAQTALFFRNEYRRAREQAQAELNAREPLMRVWNR